MKIASTTATCAFLALTLQFAAISTWAQHATFDNATGILALRTVMMNTITYENVRFVRVDPSAYRFRLMSAIAASEPQVINSYDPCTGILTIPSVAVGNASYSVTLRLIDPVTYTFELATADVVDTSTALPHFAPHWSASTNGSSTAIALHGETLATSMPRDANNIGGVTVFQRANGSWTQQAHFQASDPRYDYYFGSSLALHDNTLVVGVPSESNGKGAVYVFVRVGGVWSRQAILTAPNPDDGDYFGTSVGVDGDTLVIGAHLEQSNATGINGNAADNSKKYSGAAYVFKRTGTTWRNTAYLKASDTLAYNFGSSVAVSGSTVAVGSGQAGRTVGINCPPPTTNSSGHGAVYVFIESAGTWSQQAYIRPLNYSVFSSFGASVALSGDTLAVGDPGDSNRAIGVNFDLEQRVGPAHSGAAYVFVRNGTTWSQQAYIKASNSGSDDFFGQSVALSGDTLVVGSPGEDSNATGVNGDQRNNSMSNPGAAYVFRRLGATWRQVDYVKSFNPRPFHSFGSSVAVSGNILAVGAPLTFAGGPFVFVAP